MKYIFILLIFISCSPQKKMQRLLKKNPELIQIIDVEVKDTIYQLDTFFSEVHKDSFIITTDTIIETNKLIVERIKDKFNVVVKEDTLYALDTIYYTNTVRGKVITEYKTHSWVWWLVAFFGGIIVYGRIKPK